MSKIKDKLTIENALRLVLGINIIFYIVMYVAVISRFNEQVTNRTEEWDFETGMSGAVLVLGIGFLLSLIVVGLLQLRRKVLSGILIMIFSVIQLLTMEGLRSDFSGLSNLAYRVSDNISGERTMFGVTMAVIIEVVIVVSIILTLGMVIVNVVKGKMKTNTAEKSELSKAETYIKWTNVLVGASPSLYIIIYQLADDLKYYDFTSFNIKEVLICIRFDWIIMELLGIGLPFMIFIVVVGGALVKKGHYLLNILLYALCVYMVYNALFWEKSWSYYEFEYEDMAGFPQYIAVMVLGAMVMLSGVFYKLGRSYGAKVIEKSKEGMDNEAAR